MNRNNFEKLDYLIDENQIVTNDLVLAELTPFLKIRNQRKLITLLHQINKLAMVCVENWLGKIKVRALLTPIIHPDVVMAEHCWWFPKKEGAEPSLFGVWDVNVNQLIPMGKQGKAGLGSPIKSMLCKVSKVKV